MRVGLAGAHRSGKTTLATAVAAKLGWHLFATSITQWGIEAGFDPVAPLSIIERLELQAKLFTRYMQELDRQPTPLITDRTPLDIAAYMLCECGMHSAPEVANAVKVMADKAVECTDRWFDMVLVVPPLSSYAADPSKPAPNVAFQWHHHLVVSGLAREGEVPVGRLLAEGFDVRRECVVSVIQDQWTGISKDLEFVARH